MTVEAASADPYDTVLADLRAKRDQIDQTIELLSGLRSGGSAPPSRAPAQDAPANPAGMFLSMSIPDGVKKLLLLRQRTMGNGEIAAELQAGGLVLNSLEPANVVGSVLSRRFSQVGDIVKVSRGTWGLKEWYPGRSFKPSQKATAVDDVPPRVFELKVNDLGGQAADEDDDL